MSHTQLDKEFCNRFDTACARVESGMQAFRSEFERISPPDWKIIRDAMNRSWAMFLLVGKELVKMQEKSACDPETARSWKYTQNWIAFEIGLACQQNIDVWVLCDDVTINFPVPYFNNYLPFRVSVDWLRQILNMYKTLGHLPSPSKPLPPLFQYVCSNNQCKMEFFFWGYNRPRPFDVTCPQCLKTKPYG